MPLKHHDAGVAVDKSCSKTYRLLRLPDSGSSGLGPPWQPECRCGWELQKKTDHLHILMLAVPDLVRHDNQSIAVDESCGAGTAGGQRGGVVQELNPPLCRRPLLSRPNAVHDGSYVLHELLVWHAVQLLHCEKHKQQHNLHYGFVFCFYLFIFIDFKCFLTMLCCSFYMLFLNQWTFNR